MKVDAIVEEATSAKTGKKYIRIVIQLTPNTKKIVLLEPAESELVSLYLKADKGGKN